MVPDAESSRDFYEKVVGWKATGTDMGEYEDYCMSPAGSDEPIVKRAQAVEACQTPWSS